MLLTKVMPVNELIKVVEFIEIKESCVLRKYLYFSKW